jgi:hypothetical protein
MLSWPIEIADEVFHFQRARTLTPSDNAALESRWIDRELADRAGLRRCQFQRYLRIWAGRAEFSANRWQRYLRLDVSMCPLGRDPSEAILRIRRAMYYLPGFQMIAPIVRSACGLVAQ